MLKRNICKNLFNLMEMMQVVVQIPKIKTRKREQKIWIQYFYTYYQLATSG